MTRAIIFVKNLPPPAVYYYPSPRLSLRIIHFRKEGYSNKIAYTKQRKKLSSAAEAKGT